MDYISSIPARCEQENREVMYITMGDAGGDEDGGSKTVTYREVDETLSRRRCTRGFGYIDDVSEQGE